VHHGTEAPHQFLDDGFVNISLWDCAASFHLSCPSSLRALSINAIAKALAYALVQMKLTILVPCIRHHLARARQHNRNIGTQFFRQLLTTVGAQQSHLVTYNAL